jgi:hypothetical protein
VRAGFLGLLGGVGILMSTQNASAACAVPTGEVAYPNSVTGVFTNSPKRPLEAWSDDTSFASGICNGAFSSSVWDHFAMDEGDWNDGRGFDNYCDITKMLGKTYIAYWVILYSSPTPPPTWDDMSGNALRWAAPYSSNNIDEVDGACSWGLYGETRYGTLVDNWTRFFLDFAYMETPAVRASTVVHEARHANGWSDASHDGNDSGGAGGTHKCNAGGSSCDEAYSNSASAGRANSYQSWYFQHYSASAVNSNQWERDWARLRGNWALDNRFDLVPNMNL